MKPGGRFADRMRQQRIAMLLEETSRLIVEKGVSEFRVDEIADRVGVAKGTIYLDFGSKNALVDAAMLRCADEFERELDRRGRESSEPGERLREAVHFLARIEEDHRPLTILLPPSSSGEHPSLRDARARAGSRMAELVRAAREAGAIDPHIDDAFAGQAILASVATDAWRELVRSEGVERAAERILRALMNGRGTAAGD